MPFHLLAWAESLALVTDDSLTPVNDQVIPLSSGIFLLPNDMTLFAACAFGTTLSRAKIVQPSIRVICDDFLRPIALTLLPADNMPWSDYRQMPFNLRMNENLDIQATTSGAGPAVTSALAIISKNRMLDPAPMGQVYTLRGTATATAGVNIWTAAPMTWQNTLPQGNYAIVGMTAIGTTLKAARLIIPGQIERPGCSGVATLGIRPWDLMFNHGGLGRWGDFSNWNLPLVEVFCGSADTAQEIYLDVIPLNVARY